MWEPACWRRHQRGRSDKPRRLNREQARSHTDFQTDTHEMGGDSVRITVIGRVLAQMVDQAFQGAEPSIYYF
ncbi:hypothetical protein CF149_19496 [Pseudomonas psychrophila]|nr:hypothetical protein CF149_19496 [Pseudomonas psychrophila]